MLQKLTFRSEMYGVGGVTNLRLYEKTEDSDQVNSLIPNILHQDLQTLLNSRRANK